MELKWLEDFLALVKHGSFSKAADARFVTQPAFSRRIRSLENWLGVSLVDRSRYPTTLTEAGEAFVEEAEQIRDEIFASRDTLQAMAGGHAAIVVMSQHSLTVSFFPGWLQTIEALASRALIRLRAGNLHDAVESFFSGTGDFLLCYSSPDIYKQLERADIECIEVGTDRLVPVTAVGGDGVARFSVSKKTAPRLLSYPSESFFGRIVARECMPLLDADLKCAAVCESALAEGLKALVETGYGVAWLPQRLVANELADGRMAILGAPFASVALTIKLYRFKGEHTDPAATLWNHLLAVNRTRSAAREGVTSARLADG